MIKIYSPCACFSGFFNWHPLVSYYSVYLQGPGDIMSASYLNDSRCFALRQFQFYGQQYEYDPESDVKYTYHLC